MKKALIFIAGMLTGAIILYGYLWYDAYRTFENVWCKISTVVECEDER